MADDQVFAYASKLAGETATAAALQATAGQANGDFMRIFLELFKMLLPLLVELLKGNNQSPSAV